jgi:hypothetical protein
VATAHDQRWGELKNGALLQAAQAAGFDVFVTADQGLRDEQNLTRCPLAVIVLGSNSWPLLKRRGSQIAAVVDAALPGAYRFMDFPEAHKRRHIQRPIKPSDKP